MTEMGEADHPMERRDVLKTTGGIGVGTTIGGLGIFALTGSAAGADAQLEGIDPDAVTTDDGGIQYVAFGGRLRFEWDGLDADATHGFYNTETRVWTGDSWSNWRSHGTDYGELGADWGGGNDYTDEGGTDGVFQFKFGEEYGQQDYAIAGTGENVHDHEDGRVANPYDTSVFEADSDGSTKETGVQFRMTCAVYDGEPGNGGSRLVEDAGIADMTVVVNNREAEATTGGEVYGNTGADES